MKSPHRHGPGNTAPPGVLASRGTEALRQERFKEAIELFKQAICQEPRPEWKEGLADAWRGRARDLAAKGMFKEAAMVLENTIAQGGPVRDPKLYLTCLIRSDQQPKAAAYLLSHPAPEAEDPDLQSVAAALLVAVPRLPDAAPGITPEQSRWREIAVAARAALAAWCDGAPAEEVNWRLNAISLRSAFRPLRLLLKGLITAPDDADRARQVLETIPPGSPFHPLRQAVTVAMRREMALEADAWNRLTPAQQTFVAETNGLAAPAAQFLARLAAAERGGPGVLFNFLLKQNDLPQADLRNACLNLLPQVPDRMAQFEKSFGALPLVERCRVQALTAEARSDWEAAGQHWQRAAAAIAADKASGEEGTAVTGRYPAPPRHARDQTRGVRVPRRPGNPLPGARLRGGSRLSPQPPGVDRAVSEGVVAGGIVRLFTGASSDGSSSKDWHRLVDETVRRFPEDAAVLHQALDSALARKAYKQAEGFARRLLTINSINPGVRRQMIELQLSYARKQVRAKRPDLALKALTKASAWERSDAPSAPLRIVRGLVERRVGTAEQAEAQREAQGEARGGSQRTGGGRTRRRRCRGLVPRPA